MTFIGWTFVTLLAAGLVPAAWLAGKLVGMEKTTLGRAAAFAAVSACASGLAMYAMPFDFFLLKAVSGMLGSLAVSPFAFRLLMTGETARAVLGSLLLSAAALALTLLVLLV